MSSDFFPEGVARVLRCNACPIGPCYLETPAGVPPSYETITPLTWCPVQESDVGSVRALPDGPEAVPSVPEGDFRSPAVCRACPRGPCAFYSTGSLHRKCPVPGVGLFEAKWEVASC